MIGQLTAPAPPPDPPELPPAARPRWPAWMGFAAMGAGLVVVTVAVVPLVPVVLLLTEGGAIGALALLTLLLVQDVAFVLTAGFFARLKGRVRAWHFGLRATPPKRTLAIVVGATLAIFGFEIGYIELLGVDESNVDDITGEGTFAVFAVSLAVIVVAPVTEELFFRAFFYRSLRTHLPIWLAVFINGSVFGMLHFQGFESLSILPVIAMFGFAVCLVYEATGSVFAVIAIHAAFNTLATTDTETTATLILPLAVGVAVCASCVLAALRLGPAPSPFPPPAHA